MEVDSQLHNYIQLVCGQVSEFKASIFWLVKFDEHRISRCLSHENITTMTSLGIVQKPAGLHQHSRYRWNFSIFRDDFQHVLHRSIDFKRLVLVSCYCYPCWWWCIKFNSPTSLNFKSILQFPIKPH